MPRLPVDPPVRVTPHGAFGFQRKGPSDGRCGYRNKYPCTHKGVDLARPKGAPVYAPEAGRIAVVATSNDASGMRGFGPGSVKLVGVSGVVHTLAHLDPDWWRSPAWQIPKSIFEGFIGPDRMPAEGRAYREGEQVGVVAHDHVHWEVTVPPPKGETGVGEKLDPLKWVAGRAGAAGGGDGHGGMLLLLLLALAGRRNRR